MVFVSVRGRLLINAEALNMTESVGNYTKHRRVPVIHPHTYTVHFVPAISGEAIAHKYQEIVVEVSNEKKNFPICKLCSAKKFLKNTNKKIFQYNFDQNVPSNTHNLEKTIIERCIVEDIGGFLFAENPNVKRTSNFFTGYMIPVKEVLDQVVIEPQLHMRYALGTPFGETREGQMIYYVEMSSAVYTFSFDLDTKYIGSTTFEKIEELPDKKEREKLAIDAMKRFLLELDFGAKRTRFLPVVKPESMVIAVANDIWTVPSPFSIKYLEELIDKKEKEQNVELYVYIDMDMLTNTTEYIKQTTQELIESFYNALTEIEEILKSKGDDNLIDIDKIKKEWLEKFITDKANEIAKSKDLSYVNNIAKKYEEYIKKLEEKGITIYDKYTEFINKALNFASSKLQE